MKNKIQLVFISLICTCIVFLSALDSKFYGFEYEDSFINSYIASQNNYFDFIKNFRTEACNKFKNGKCVETSSYTGHYFFYSLYLSTISNIFNLENHLIHKIGNFLLCFLSLLMILYSEGKIKIKSCLLIIGILSSLPFYYVFNSSLIENLSFTIGVCLIVLMYKFKDKLLFKSLFIFLIFLLCVIKRENLIYCLLLPLFLNKLELKKIEIYFPLLMLFLSQLLLNPFYTEFLEADYLNRPTFSLNYLSFQLPKYILSLFKAEGFLILTLIVGFFSKPKKRPFTFYRFLYYLY